MAASSSAVQVRVLEEASPGVIGTGNPQRYRVSGESLTQSIETVRSQELRADRMTPDSVITAGSAGGALNFELSHKTHDTFFEALLAGEFVPVGTNGVVTISDATFSAVDNSINSVGGNIPDDTLEVGQWFSISGAADPENNGIFRVSPTTAPTANKLVVDSQQATLETNAVATSVVLSSSRLKNGLEPLRTFTIEKEFSDIAQFFTFTGMGVQSMSLEFSTGSILTGSFNFLGRQCTRGTVSGFSGISGEIDATETPVFNSVIGTQVMLDDAPIGDSCANSLSISVETGLRELRCISSGIGAADLNVGTFVITMTTELYFSGNTAAVYDKMITGSPLSLAICVSDDEGNGLAFVTNRCKIASSEVVAGGIDQDVVMSITVDATLDPDSDSMLIIDRIGSVA
jgi:hypothetical protein